MERVLPFIAAAGGLWWLVTHLGGFNRRPCRRCGGTGREQSAVFKRHRVCRRCKGSGWVRGLFGRSE